MFQKAKGVLFHTPAEMELASKLYGIEPSKCALIGEGVDTQIQGNGAHFKAKYHLDQYFLYAGRKDEGKNVHLLVQYFSDYKKVSQNNVKLVLIGGGQIDIPPEHAGKDIVDLGYVPAQDKYDAYAGATALYNPSLNESFSIVIMESWLCGAPVVVHENCEVTRDHCLFSNGGLYFNSFQDFVGCTDYLLSHPETQKQMAQNGANYVKANFEWPIVLDKINTSLKNWNLIN